MELITPRLLLREFRTGDETAVHAFAGDPEVTRFTDWGPNTPADSAGFVVDAVRESRIRPRTRLALAVVERADGGLVGSVELRMVDSTHQRGEIGYVLARHRWGNGFATEAATALLRFGFERLALHRISATCDPDNVASARVLERIGMAREGRLCGYLRLRGQWRDRLLYAAVAPDSDLHPAPAPDSDVPVSGH